MTYKTKWLTRCTESDKLGYVDPATHDEYVFAHRLAEVIYTSAGIVWMLGICLIAGVVIMDFLNIV